MKKQINVLNSMRRACLAATALLLMMSMVLGTSGVRAAEAESELPRNMLDPFFEAVWRFDDWMQYEIAEAKRLEAERIEQERLRRIAGMQLKEAWGRLSQITEETPWLIRVNQNTCTVTVYRVLEIKESDIIFCADADPVPLAESHDLCQVECHAIRSFRQIAVSVLLLRVIIENRCLVFKKSDPVLIKFKGEAASKIHGPTPFLKSISGDNEVTVRCFTVPRCY